MRACACACLTPRLVFLACENFRLVLNNSIWGKIKNVDNAKVMLIQFCLSAPKTDMDNTVVVSEYEQMDRILKAERKYLLKLCKAIKKTGCNVLLIQKSILRDAYNSLSMHFLAKLGPSTSPVSKL